ncbi:MAG: alpha/beta fold hydrolase [Thermomicrobiales bacterium]|nr:alpha/beta fold hydrolase [Thermomicrobiales bacterium]
MSEDVVRIDTALGWLTYRAAGDGAPAVLCIHGFNQSSVFWEPAIARLGADGARAIAVDLPGFGSAAEAPGPYTMEAYADRLSALLDALSVERACVVGGSMGGVVAQHFALRHPDRLARLVLVATGARTPDPAGALAKADKIATSPLTDADIAQTVAGFFSSIPDHVDRLQLEAIARMPRQAVAVEVMRSNANSNTLDRLAEIEAPTLIVQGRHDRGRTPEHGELMATLMPNARLAVLEHSGHTPQLEEPDAFLETVQRFLLSPDVP